jgi:hypothetical protein
VNRHLVTLSNDVIANNHVTSATVFLGQRRRLLSAGEISGTSAAIRLTGNTVVRSATGSANGEAARRLRRRINLDLISDNHVHVSALVDS